jgi:hypothetical protein
MAQSRLVARRNSAPRQPSAYPVAMHRFGSHRTEWAPRSATSHRTRRSARLGSRSSLSKHRLGLRRDDGWRLGTGWLSRPVPADGPEAVSGHGSPCRTVSAIRRPTVGRTELARAKARCELSIAGRDEGDVRPSQPAFPRLTPWLTPSRPAISAPRWTAMVDGSDASGSPERQQPGARVARASLQTAGRDHRLSQRATIPGDRRRPGHAVQGGGDH